MKKFKITFGIREPSTGRHYFQYVYVPYGLKIVGYKKKDVHILSASDSVVGILHYEHGVLDIEEIAAENI